MPDYRPQTDSLEDGTPVVTQLCCSLDGRCDREGLKEGLQQAMTQLSVQSRWFRFGSPVNTLSPEQLDYLSDIDNKARLAICGFDAGHGNARIGLARYVRLPEEKGIAEFAITVLDAYQRRGAGTVLLRRLIACAKQNGIKILRGFTLPGNRGMLRLGKRFGGRMRQTEDGMVIDIAV